MLSVVLLFGTFVCSSTLRSTLLSSPRISRLTQFISQNQCICRWCQETDLKALCHLRTVDLKASSHIKIVDPSPGVQSYPEILNIRHQKQERSVSLILDSFLGNSVCLLIIYRIVLLEQR